MRVKLSLCAILIVSVINAEESFLLDSSVISATGYEQNLKDAPASISIISKEEIQNKPIRDLGDIVQEIPGVSTSTAKTGAQDISIRGLSSSYALILVDGKRINMSKGFDSNGFDSTSGWMPPISAIERVEIIRGPASIIYGSDAMGGVINIITKKNINKASGSVALEGRLQQDNHWGNMYGLNANIYAPLDKGVTLNLRGKYNYGESNEFLISEIAGYTNTEVIKKNPYTSHSPTGFINGSIGGRLSYIPSDKNNFYLDIDYGYQRLGSLNTSSKYVTAIRHYERFNYILNHDGTYDFGKINNYIHFATISRYPHDNVSLGANYGRPNKAALVYNQTFTYGTTFTKNFDFDKYGSMILNVGDYFFKERLYQRQNKNDKSAYQIALFGEGEYFVNDHFSTTTGLRINYLQTYGTFLAPRLYFNVYPYEWLTLKAGLASGLQVPQLATRFDDYQTTSGSWYYANKDLKPERSLNYEVSAIAQTDIATFSSTIFYTDFTDAISQKKYENNKTIAHNSHKCSTTSNNSSNSEYCYTYENTDKARSMGLEFGINSKALFTDFIARGIYIDFSYSLIDTDKRSGIDKGRPLNNVPLHNITTKLSYKGEGWDMYLRYIGKYKIPTYGVHSANMGPGRWYKDLHTVDLGVNYKFKNNISIGAVINNLFNINTIDYFVYTSNSKQRYSNSYQRMIPGRNIWLTIRANF